MASVKERLEKLERYKRGLDPSGVAMIAITENGEWRAEYGRNTDAFPTEAQALHFIHQNAPKGVPIIIIDV